MNNDTWRLTVDEKMQNFFFFKGRVALYAILKAVGVRPGDEVILPGFTCVVVPNAVIYLGARPVYVDIDPKTFTIDVSKIEANISAKTKVIISQNTFGLSADLDPIMNLGKKYNLFIVEDCAHGYGGYYKGRPNGTVADAAFFSSQWSKPFSTGLGGIAVTNSPELAAKIKREHDSYQKPRSAETLMLFLLLQSYRFFMKPAIYWPAINAYRFFSRRGWVTGSSSGQELVSPIKPEDFEKRMPEFLEKRVHVEMQKFSKNLKHRLWVARHYDDIFDGLGLEKPRIPDYAVHTFLRYPFFVRDKERFLRRAVEHRIEMGDWFASPLHPVKGNLSPWYYARGRCPIAESACEQIVNLPTHTRINTTYIHKLNFFLEEMYRENIL